MRWLTGLGLALLAFPHVSLASGDAKAGLTYAMNVCSECHAVRRGARFSAHERAPAFQVVAEAPGMTETALRVWFQSPHPSMPLLVIPEERADDLVAYFLSLKQTRGNRSR